MRSPFHPARLYLAGRLPSIDKSLVNQQIKIYTTLKSPPDGVHRTLAFELLLEARRPEELCAAIERHLATGDCFDLYPIDTAPTRRRFRWARSISMV